MNSNGTSGNQIAWRAALAPAGKLRVGVYPGSPLSMVRDRITGEFHGLTIDLIDSFHRLPARALRVAGRG